MKNLLFLGVPFLIFSLPVFAKGSLSAVIHLSPALCKTKSIPVADGSIPTPHQVAKDAYCAAEMMKDHAPRGTVTIFGSARTQETDVDYKMTREFAKLWTQKLGKEYPILTGGGRGIMEAGNRGAADAGGQSLSISTSFTGAVETLNPYGTFNYIAASFSQREADLVDYAAAIVVAPGGFGTEWEIYESLSKMQTRKKNLVPLVLLGGKAAWTNLMQRVQDLKNQNTIGAEDPNLILIAESPAAAVSMIEAFLHQAKRAPSQEKILKSPSKPTTRQGL